MCVVFFNSGRVLGSSETQVGVYPAQSGYNELCQVISSERTLVKFYTGLEVYKQEMEYEILDQ